MDSNFFNSLFQFPYRKINSVPDNSKFIKILLSYVLGMAVPVQQEYWRLGKKSRESTIGDEKNDLSRYSNK